jgi:hypothetical protein
MSDENKNLSIHPRHWPNTGNGKKVNTNKTKLRSTIERSIAAIQKYLEDHPNDARSRMHLKKLQDSL